MNRPKHLLHISFLVEDRGALWPLLRALEAHRAGNVEVRPVSGPGTDAALEAPPQSLALAAPDIPHIKAALVQPGFRRHGGGRPNTRNVVLNAMKPGKSYRPPEVAQACGLTYKQVTNALYNLAKAGELHRPSIGVYILASGVKAGRR